MSLITDLDLLVALARTCCLDVILAESLGYSLGRTDAALVLDIGPETALPELCRAHRELRGSMSDETNEILDRTWEKYNL
ncbi:MAG: hypothetical protein WCK39_03875 [Methanomassiliicoccales archaeon]